MRLVLDILYFFGLLLATPMILWRMIRHGRYRTHIAERLLGRVPRIAHDGPVVWVHAVSLGETNASLLLAKELRTQIPNVHLVISSTTDTGLAAAVRLYGDAQDATVIQWPLDFSLAVATALGRIRPNTVVMMEGEAWPNFLSACQRRRIPTMIVNARISPNKGYPRYKKLGPIAPWLFNKLTRIGCQTQAYADLFASLGVREDKVTILESSHDIHPRRGLRQPFEESGQAFAAFFGLRIMLNVLRLIDDGDRSWFAGLDAFQQFPDLVFLRGGHRLVPSGVGS